MESPSNIVLLYSKYSPNCKNIMDIIKTNNMSFIFPLCVDNQQIREVVLKSSFAISSVPCLLVTYPSGGIEKFEGINVSEWLNNLMEKVNPPPQTQPQPQPQVQPQQESYTPEPSRQKNIVINSESDNEIEEEIQKPKSILKKSKKPTPKPKSSKNSEELTDINDLLGIENDDEINNDDPLNGLAPRIINPKNGNEIKEDFLDMNDANEKVKKAVKGGSSIMSLAQEMQKARDKEEKRYPPGVAPPSQ